VTRLELAASTTPTVFHIIISQISSSPVYNPVWNETQQEYMTFPVSPHNDKIPDTPCASESDTPYFS